jgi:hypothetical protein
MRVAVQALLLLLFAAGCATSITPRQYLDEETAATITVVARPWIFAVANPGVDMTRRGYLNLYALDVNRTGSHQHYFAVLQSSFDVALPDEKSSTPTLEVQTSDRKLVFKSISQSPRQLGIAQPLAQPIALQSRWWYFAASREEIAAVAQLQSPHVTLVANDIRFAYVEFQSAGKELTEFSATLP